MSYARLLEIPEWRESKIRSGEIKRSLGARNAAGMRNHVRSRAQETPVATRGYIVFLNLEDLQKINHTLLEHTLFKKS